MNLIVKTELKGKLYHKPYFRITIPSDENTYKATDYQLDNLGQLYKSIDGVEAIVITSTLYSDYWRDIERLVMNLRFYTSDDIVIYTHFKESDIRGVIDRLSVYDNVIVKFGRDDRKDKPHFDDVLGVELSSSNQYAKKISIT